MNRFKATFIFIAFFNVFCTLGSIAQVDTSRIKAVDSLFNSKIKKDYPGCAVGIIYRGKTLLSKGYGLSNIECQRKITPSTPICIASTSKQFIATAIYMLQEENKLSIHDKIRKYFPELNPVMDSITIYHLLHHTSGIRCCYTLSQLQAKNIDDKLDLDDIFRLLCHQNSLSFEPGSKYNYGTSGYILLMLIIEKITKESISEYLKKHVFEPLGMSSTYFISDEKTVIKDDAQSYKVHNGKIDKYNSNSYYGVTISLEDFFKWDGNLYSDKLLKGKLSALLTEQGKLNDGRLIDYGSGLHIRSYLGYKTISHTGFLAGYNSNYLYYPELQLSIIILMNRNDLAISSIGREISRILLNTDPDPIKASDIKDMRTPKIGNEILSNYVGDYWLQDWDGGGFEYHKIILKNDTLNYIVNKDFSAPLIPLEKDSFIMLNNYQKRFVKFKTENGVLKMRVTSDGFTYEEFKYKPAHPREEEFKRYMGTYYSSELNVVLTIDTINHKLRNKSILFENELSPICERVFQGYTQVYEFVEDKKKNITELILSDVRAQKIHFKKVRL